MTKHKLSNHRQNDRELTPDELEIVSGGGKAASTKTASAKGKPETYLQIDLTECSISG